MPPDTNADPSRRKWQVLRTELLYSYPKHSTWQWHIYAPGLIGDDKTPSDESLHRKEIRALLSAVYDMVKAKIGGAKKIEGEKPVLSNFELREVQEGPEPTLIPIELDEIDHLPWSDYFTYLLCAARESTIKSKHIEEISKFAGIISAAKDGTRTKSRTKDGKTTKYIKIEMDRHLAAVLLTLVPILEDWDTWGLLRQVQIAAESAEGSAGSGASGSSSLSDSKRRRQLSNRRRQLEENAKKWVRPELHNKSYLFGYHILGPNVRGDKSAAGRVIQVAGAICGETSEEGSRKWKCSSAQDDNNTFEFVNYTDPPYAPAPDEKEHSLYHCYGRLVRQIIEAKVAGNDSQTHLFSAIYPITYASRIHFLQITFCPVVEEGSRWAPVLSDLWEDWKGFHAEFWTPEMRDFLRRDLLRIQRHAFISGIRQDMEEPPDELASMDGPTRRMEMLKRHLFEVLPVESILEAPADASAGKYPGYEYRNFCQESLQIGKEWIKRESSLPDLGVPANNKNWIPTPWADRQLYLNMPTGRDRNDALIRSRSRYAVAEMLREAQNLVQIVEDAHLGEKERKTQDRQTASIVVNTFLRRKQELSSDPMMDIATLLNEEIPEDLRQPGFLSDPDRDYTKKENTLARYVALSIDKKDEASQVEYIEMILNPSVVQMLSEYMETGPVLLASHTEDDPKGWKSRFLNPTNERIKDSRDRHYAKLHQSICRIINNYYSRMPSKDQFDRFHLDCLPIRSDGILWSDKREKDQGFWNVDAPAADAREKLHIYEFIIGNHRFELGDSFRIYGIDPGSVLRVFSERYIVKTGHREIRSGVIFHRHSGMFYWGPYHSLEGQSRIELLHQYCVLPFSDRDKDQDIGPDALLTSHLVDHWPMGEARIGELFYRHSSGTVYRLIETIGNNNGRTRSFIASEELSAVQGFNNITYAAYILRFDHWCESADKKCAEHLHGEE